MSSEDIKHDLLKQGLLSPKHKLPHPSLDLDSKHGHMSGELSDTSGIAEETSVVSIEEVNDFYGGDSENISESS